MLGKSSDSIKCHQDLASSPVSSASTSLIHRSSLYAGSRFYVVWFKLKQKQKGKEKNSCHLFHQLLSLVHASRSLRMSLIGSDWSWTHSQANHWVQVEVVLWPANPGSHGHSWSWNRNGTKVTTGMESGGGVPPQRELRTIWRKTSQMSTTQAKEQGETHTHTVIIKS